MSVEDDAGPAATGAAEVAPTAFTDVLSATFQQEIANGADPEAAFLTAQTASQEVATQMGVPAEDVAANLETAAATFTNAIEAGTDPAAAMVSAAGQAATSMGMEPGVAGGDATDIISGAMGSAYDAAIEAGSSPAEAFTLGKAAAETAAQDMGIDPAAPGPFLDTMTSVQATFTDAVSSGADPLAAMAGAQGMMDAGPALIGDPGLIAADPAFAGPLEAGFAGGMPEGFAAPTMAVGADGTLVQPPVMGDAMMMGPGGVPMVNPAMMQPGAMECGPDGSFAATDPNHFPPPPFGDPSFVAPTIGMPGFEAFSSLATQIGLDPAAASTPGFVPPVGTPGMDQPGMPGGQVFDPASGGFAPPTFGLPDPNPEGFTIPTPPAGDSFTAPPADFFDPGAFPPVGGTELGFGSFAGPGAPLVPGADGTLVQDPNFVTPGIGEPGFDTGFVTPGIGEPGVDTGPGPGFDTGFVTPGIGEPGVDTGPGPGFQTDPGNFAADSQPNAAPVDVSPAGALDQAFAPEPAPVPTFDPVADAVGGAIDSGTVQAPAPAPEPAPAPAPEPVIADVPDVPTTPEPDVV
jgi:hypothetical protein